MNQDPNHLPFAGKVILITGGTSGIGRETAVAFAKHGASVVVAGRRETEGAESAALIERAGGKGMFVRTDVSKEDDHAALVAKTLDRFGRLDCAFNNAGILPPNSMLTEKSKDEFDRTIGTNVGGTFFGMKHQIPAMLKNGGGAIVNNASVLGIRPLAGSSIYNASKFAVIGMTKSAAVEFASQGIRVNAICPGLIETDMTDHFRGNDALRNYLLALHPIGRFGKSHEIAETVVFLCSGAASFITGVALPVDGGLTS